MGAAVAIGNLPNALLIKINTDRVLRIERKVIKSRQMITYGSFSYLKLILFISNSKRSYHRSKSRSSSSSSSSSNIENNNRNNRKKAEAVDLTDSEKQKFKLM